MIYAYIKSYRKFIIFISAFVFIVGFLHFIAIFIALPLTFMHSYEMQRDFVFPRWLGLQEQEFTNFEKYKMEGTRNLYISVDKNHTIKLGMWHILPWTLAPEAKRSNNFSYKKALRNSHYPVVLFLHGNSGNRISNRHKYGVLRKFFHVLAFDYRGYGDSSKADLTEDAIVRDCVEVYKWLQSQTNADIYVWGHSLGSSIAAHTTARLRNRGIPAGLVLETPFTTLRDEVKCYPQTKIFAWLPWFDATMRDPLEGNGFVFDTTKHTLSVDCPIMIIHAEDDEIVPFSLGEKLYQIVKEIRNETAQGIVIFRKIPGHFGFGHNNIYKATELPSFIRHHIKVCQAFKERVRFEVVP